jgi:hypothetical protein
MDLLEDNFFFKKIRFIESFNVELNSTAENFKDTFKNNVKETQKSYGIARPKIQFQGKIKQDAFSISKTFSAFDNDPILASGTYSTIGEKLAIKVFVYLPIVTFILIYSIILFIGILSIYLFANSGNEKEISSIIIFGTVMISFPLLWPYIFIRRNIDKKSRRTSMKEQVLNEYRFFHYNFFTVHYITVSGDGQ